MDSSAGIAVETAERLVNHADEYSPQNKMLYPISYSVPEEIIVPYVPFKTHPMAKHEYQFSDSQLYLKNYRHALFGETSLKCGWDAFRHYEILSQGTIPYFHNLQACPKRSLHTFPKELVLTLMDKYGQRSWEEIQKMSSSQLYKDLDELLSYTRDTMTTRKQAEYLLSKGSVPGTKKVLFLHNSVGTGDYLCELTAHGLLKYTEGEVDIYPELPHLYESFPIESTKNLYGKGFNYTRMIPDRYQKNLAEDSVWEFIKEGKYDQIVTYFECMSNKVIPFSIGDRDVRRFYDTSKISLLCGHDCDPYWSEEKNWYIRMQHECGLKALQPIFNVFIREFGD